jgi:(p)ppGpp synthase/HD superfamily hydrolase
MKLEQTYKLMQKLHEGQTDKAGNPYWKHPVSVMNIMLANFPWADNEDYCNVALLHDTVEDDCCTMDDLRNYGFSNTVLNALFLLNRKNFETMTYVDWIKSIANSGNLIAITVKLSDNMDNSDPKRIYNLPPEQQKKFQEMADSRYRISMLILKAKLMELGLV